MKSITYFNVMNFLAKVNEFVLPFNYQEQTYLRETHMSVALKGLGFKFTNSILTLKNAGQMLFINYCLIIYLICLYIKSSLSEKNDDRRKCRKLKERLFFSPFLGMAIRCYIPMSIASYLNIKY